MNSSALRALREAEDDLAALLERAPIPDPRRADFAQTQRLWSQFAEHQARERAGILSNDPGTMSTTVYAAEKENLVRTRIAELKDYLNRLNC